MIASLQMYQRPELVDAHDKFWKIIRNKLALHGIESPKDLSQDADEMTVWEDPKLVLSQTCGMPFRTHLHDKVTLIGTPDFGVKNCIPGYYSSAFIVNQSDVGENLIDYKDSLFAYNDIISQSGYASAFFETKKDNFFFENRICSGGHLDSARMVAEGKAEIACIDPISLTFMSEYEKFYNELRIIKWTKPTPSLPYISAIGIDQKIYFDVISEAISELPKDVRERLHLKGLVYIPKEKYLTYSNPEIHTYYR